MRTRKENRELVLDESIKIRLTKKEKREFQSFCKREKIVMSKHVRELILNAQRK